MAKQDEAILVRELAKEIYPTLLFGNDHVMAGAVPKRVLSTIMRTTSDLSVPDAKEKQRREGRTEMGENKVLMSVATPVKGEEKPKHKRKISRSQLR